MPVVVIVDTTGQHQGTIVYLWATRHYRDVQTTFLVRAVGHGLIKTTVLCLR